MKPFSYFQPTEIHFGCGRVKEVGELVARFGKRCLLVTVPEMECFTALYQGVFASLKDAKVETSHFDGVVPNPTVESVTAGAEIAKRTGADVILGLGGGSSMDTAKAIAVEVTHPGRAWDYLFFRETQPTANTLPVIAVTTTSGTGSQVTQVSVITDPETKTKSAIYNSYIYPRACIVDPELTITVPRHITASTGFDVFCHAFEAYLHPNVSPYIELIALEALRLVIAYLPNTVEDGGNLEARVNMAWADTLAGLSIANAGVTLPHGIGMTIGGHCPWVMHGEALAVVYPEFMRFTYASAIKRFATLGRLFNPSLASASDEAAAEQSCAELEQFLKDIGMWLSLEGLNVNRRDVDAIADNSRVLPDYKNNPRIASRDEIYGMLANSYHR